MSKIMNEASGFVDQSLAGIVAANPNEPRTLRDLPTRVVRAGQAKATARSPS